MKTLLLAVLALPFFGLLASEPAVTDPAEADPGVSGPAASVVRAREVMISQLHAQTDLARETLATLKALDAAGLDALREAARTALAESSYVVANVELWATLRASVGALALPDHVLDEQRADMLAVGGEAIALLVEGQERFVVSLNELLDARWDVIVALQLATPDTEGVRGHEIREIADVVELLDSVPMPNSPDTRMFLSLTPLDRALDVLADSANGDWEAKGVLIQVSNALSDMDLDAGRVIQVSREAVEGRDLPARRLMDRSAWVRRAADPLRQALLSYVMVGC